MVQHGYFALGNILLTAKASVCLRAAYVAVEESPGKPYHPGYSVSGPHPHKHTDIIHLVRDGRANEQYCAYTGPPESISLPQPLANPLSVPTALPRTSSLN